MSKSIFNESQHRILERNEAVQAITDRSVSLTPEFKIKAVKEYQTGKSPSDIFIVQGLDLDIIGPKKPKEYLSRGFKRSIHGDCLSDPCQTKRIIEWKHTP